VSGGAHCSCRLRFIAATVLFLRFHYHFDRLQITTIVDDCVTASGHRSRRISSDSHHGQVDAAWRVFSRRRCRRCPGPNRWTDQPRSVRNFVSRSLSKFRIFWNETIPTNDLRRSFGQLPVRSRIGNFGGISAWNCNVLLAKWVEVFSRARDAHFLFFRVDTGIWRQTIRRLPEIL
jgi:hypothetical protein